MKHATRSDRVPAMVASGVAVIVIVVVIVAVVVKGLVIRDKGRKTCMISMSGSCFADAQTSSSGTRPPTIVSVDRMYLYRRGHAGSTTWGQRGRGRERVNLEPRTSKSLDSIGARRIASPTDYLVLVGESPELDHLRRGKWFRLRFARPLLIVRYPHGSTWPFTPANKSVSRVMIA